MAGYPAPFNRPGCAPRRRLRPPPAPPAERQDRRPHAREGPHPDRPPEGGANLAAEGLVRGVSLRYGATHDGPSGMAARPLEPARRLALCSADRRSDTLRAYAVRDGANRDGEADVPRGADAAF